MFVSPLGNCGCVRRRRGNNGMVLQEWGFVLSLLIVQYWVKEAWAGLNGNGPEDSSVMSDFLRPHGLQHTKPPCPSPTPRVHSNSCPLSRWCHPAISSSVIPFSSWLQSFPASGSFQMSQFFSSGQSIRVSASASLLPVNIEDWFPLRWTGWISQKWRMLNGRCQALSSRVWSENRLNCYGEQCGDFLKNWK